MGLANELRIGNWLTAAGKSKLPFEVNAEDIVAMTNGSQAQPIPLNDQILNDSLIGQLKRQGYYLDKGEIINWLLCEDYAEGDGGTHVIAVFDYVHQLQNLYFALTGEELPIEP